MDFVEKEAQRIEEGRLFNERLLETYRESQTRDTNYLKSVWPAICGGLEEACNRFNLRLKKQTVCLRVLETYHIEIFVPSASRGLDCWINFEERTICHAVNMTTEVFTVAEKVTPEQIVEAVFCRALRLVQ